MSSGRKSGVIEFVSKVFAEQHAKHLPDSKITAMLVKKFGKRDYFADISNLRSAYNRGAYTDRKPKKIVKYDLCGNPIKPWTREKTSATKKSAKPAKRSAGAKTHASVPARAPARHAGKKPSGAVLANAAGKKPDGDPVVTALGTTSRINRGPLDGAAGVAE